MHVSQKQIIPDAISLRRVPLARWPDPLLQQGRQWLLGQRIPVEQFVRSQLDAPDDLVACAVIGFGAWGREISKAIDEIEDTELTAICDNFPLMLRRAQRAHPNARRGRRIIERFLMMNRSNPFLSPHQPTSTAK